MWWSSNQIQGSTRNQVAEVVVIDNEIATVAVKVGVSQIFNLF